VTRLGWLAAYLLLTSCQPVPPTVDATQYESFWLWAGVKPQAVLDKARTIYILEGEVRGSDRPQLISLRPATPQVQHAELWIVYRVETIDWNEKIYQQIVGDLARWRQAGNRMMGVQIDFDAATKGLGGYVEFLRGLRKRLPSDSALSVTGLLDWSSQGDVADLNQLAAVVDELVLQTYQGRSTISGYETYLTSLDRIEMPYKIGLVQNGEWKAPAALAKDPNFRGYVVFLVNPRP
jgi:hypothetical protein